jgi:hypothetical protein
MKYRKLAVACALLTLLAAWAAAFCWYQAVTLDGAISDTIRTGDESAVAEGKTVDQYLHESTESVNRYSAASLALEGVVAASLLSSVIFYVLSRHRVRQAVLRNTSAPSPQQ